MVHLGFHSESHKDSLSPCAWALNPNLPCKAEKDFHTNFFKFPVLLAHQPRPQQQPSLTLSSSLKLAQLQKGLGGLLTAARNLICETNIFPDERAGGSSSHFIASTL